MEMNRRRSASLLKLLLAVVTSTVAVTSTSNNCHILCQGRDNCKATCITNTCYVHFISKTKTWTETQNWCRELNMEMVKIPNDLEAYVMDELMKFVGPADTWLGGRTVNLDKWTYVNGNPLNTTEFPFFKYTRSYHQCGVVSHEHRNRQLFTGLDLLPCYNDLPYICRSDSSLYHGLYQPMTKRMNWFGARQICRDTGGDLLYVKEGETVKALLKDYAEVQNENVTELFFIGLRHRKWEWQDGSEITDSNWNSSEQNYQKFCLMLKDGKLRADGCFKQGQVICKGEFSKSTAISRTTSALPARTQTTKTERRTTTKASSALQREKLVSNTNFSLADKTMRSPPTSAYFTAMVFFGCSLLLLVVAFPLILCWIKRPKKESDDQEMEDHIYCEVTLERDPSRIARRQNERRSVAPSIEKDSPQQNVSTRRLGRLNASVTTPFSRTSADDVLIMDNHLYGSSDELAEEAGQRRCDTALPQNQRMYDEAAFADRPNHLHSLSE